MVLWHISIGKGGGRTPVIFLQHGDRDPVPTRQSKGLTLGKNWEWKDCKELYLTEDGVEQWKSYFYEIEGWDKDSGYPKRKTLEDLGLKHVADLLSKKLALA